MMNRDSASTLLLTFLQPIRKRKPLSLAIIVTLIIAVVYILFALPVSIATGRELDSVGFSTLREPTKCTLPHFAPDGGDCQALGEMRRPKWACFSDMREEIPRFLKVYRHRPFKSNDGGIRMDHGTLLVSFCFSCTGMSLILIAHC